jgi:hypothetical protein
MKKSLFNNLITYFELFVDILWLRAKPLMTTSRCRFSWPTPHGLLFAYRPLKWSGPSKMVALQKRSQQIMLWGDSPECCAHYWCHWQCIHRRTCSNIMTLEIGCNALWVQRYDNNHYEGKLQNVSAASKHCIMASIGKCEKSHFWRK